MPIPVKIAIVPSCEINPESEDRLTGTRTLARLEKVLEMYRSDDIKLRPDYIVVSGGAVYAIRKGLTTPHAHIMRDWLIAHGVPAKVVLVEDKSLDSYQNVKNSLELLKRKLEFSEYRDATYYLVTERNHAKRMLFTFHNYEIDLDDVTSVDAGYELSPSELRLEKFYYYLHKFSPRGRNPLAWVNRRCRR